MVEQPSITWKVLLFWLIAIFQQQKKVQFTFCQILKIENHVGFKYHKAEFKLEQNFHV